MAKEIEWEYPALGDKLEQYQPGLQFRNDDGEWVESGVITATMSQNLKGQYRYPNGVVANGHG